MAPSKRAVEEASRRAGRCTAIEVVGARTRLAFTSQAWPQAEPIESVPQERWPSLSVSMVLQLVRAAKRTVLSARRLVNVEVASVEVAVKFLATASPTTESLA